MMFPATSIACFGLFVLLSFAVDRAFSSTFSVTVVFTQDNITLFQTTCLKMSQNQSMDRYERALYAALWFVQSDTCLLHSLSYLYICRPSAL